MLFTGLGSVLIVKNCDLGLENLFFTIRTSRPANNINLLTLWLTIYLSMMCHVTRVS